MTTAYLLLSMFNFIFFYDYYTCMDLEIIQFYYLFAKIICEQFIFELFATKLFSKNIFFFIITLIIILFDTVYNHIHKINCLYTTNVYECI